MKEEELKNQILRDQLEFKNMIDNIQKLQKKLKQLNYLIRQEQNPKMQKILKRLDKSTEVLMKQLDNLISQAHSQKMQEILKQLDKAMEVLMIQFDNLISQVYD